MIDETGGASHIKLAASIRDRERGIIEPTHMVPPDEIIGDYWHFSVY